MATNYEVLHFSSFSIPFYVPSLRLKYSFLAPCSKHTPSISFTLAKLLECKPRENKDLKGVTNVTYVSSTFQVDWKDCFNLKVK
jgi:hypothetical protein